MALLLRWYGSAFTTWPSGKEWVQTLLLFLFTALVIGLLGFRWGFLECEVVSSIKTAAMLAMATLFLPSLAEEVAFRVLWLPHGLPGTARLWLAGLSLVIFVGYHPFKVKLMKTKPVLGEPVFLGLASVLGLACTIAYLGTASIWPSVAIHWLIVAIWLICFGGYRRLQR